MRFFLGLVLGAAAVLATMQATTLRPQWQTWLTRAFDDVGGWLSRPGGTWSRPAAEPPSTAPAPAPDVAAAADPASLDRQAPVAAVSVAEASAATASAAAAAAAPASAGQETIWVPFHSEMSARGFAERLTRSLHHPFQVERRGPGRYQVVFAYDDEPERQALLARASKVTGLPL